MTGNILQSVIDADLIDGGVIPGGAGANDTLDTSAVTQGLFIDLDATNAAGTAVSEDGFIRNVASFDGEPQQFQVTVADFENTIGTAQDDVLFGNAQDNTLRGGGGDDRIHAFGGNDVYDGGAGVDTALFNQAVRGIIANLETGLVFAGGDVNQLESIENINGGAFRDLIRGDNGANVINGLDGADIIIGAGGDDTINGGDRADTIRGDGGNDTINGDAGRDLIRGGAGDDTINGGDGPDTLVGNAGADTLRGGEGNDFLRGGVGDDILLGDTGDDIIRGNDGNDTSIWNNGDGSDTINLGAGDDRQIVNLADVNGDGAPLSDDVTIRQSNATTIFERNNLGEFALNIRNTETLEVNGQSGDDIFRLEGDVLDSIAVDIDGGANSDSGGDTTNAAAISTGDTLDLSQLGSAAQVDLDINNQGLLTAEGLSALFPEVDGVALGENTQFGRLTVDGQNFRLADVENLIGTDFSDVLFGNSESNVIIGGDGDDNIHPFGGVDFVDGGAGTDVINLSGAGGLTIDIANGVAGPNTFINIENALGSVNGDDVIIGDDRTDIAQTVTFTLNNADGVAVNGNVLNGRGGDDTLLGGAGNDQLIGDDGSGADGADALNGQTGNDFLTGGAGADQFGFSANEGADVISDFSISDDQFVFNASSFGVTGDLAFQNVARVGGANDDPNAGLVGVQDGNNVFVLQGEFTGNAAGAADALAAELAGGVDEGAGFFVYFNTGQQINRLFHVEDLDDANAQIMLVANLGEFNGDASATDADAIRDALADFEADSFNFGFDDTFGAFET